MKIAIDCRSLMNPPTGVANYLITAINQISKAHPSCILYLLVNRDLNKKVDERIIKRKNVIIIKRPMKYFGKVALVWYIFKLYFILKDIRPDFFWTPANTLPPVVPKGIKTVVTVQDFVSKQYANTMMFVDRIYYSLLFSKSVQKADILTTLSHYTKEEIEKKIPNRKCTNIFVGVSIDNHLFQPIRVENQEKKAILNKYKLKEKVLLFVGTIEPRKNLKFLISLMPDLAKHGFRLLIVGAKGWRNSGIDSVMNKKDFPKESVAFSGFVSKDELIKIYNIASLLVLPSINEGFGLPALEAMSSGCPVVAADNSALHEVVAGGGKLVKGWKRSNWIDSILDVYHDREKYVTTGLSKSNEYHSLGSIEKLIDRLENDYNMSSTVYNYISL